MEEMHGRHTEKQDSMPADGTEVGDNQEKQRQEELEKQRQEELEKIEAQKQEETRNNQARIEAKKIAQTTEAPASSPNWDKARKVKEKLEWSLSETFP